MENNPAPVQPKVSHKASVTGTVLAVLSLALSGIGNLLVRAEYTPSGSTTGDVESEVGNAVASGTTTVLGALLGVPLLVGGIALAFLSAIFVLLRLRKVRIAGLIFSIVVILLLALSVSIAFGAFDLIKAKPA